MTLDVAAADLIVVLTTTGSERQALDIASHLVGNGLVACVNILPAVRSVFRWKGKIDVADEHLLIAKTVRARFDAVRDAIRELHAYEVPEVLALPATLADEAFGRWVRDSSRGE